MIGAASRYSPVEKECLALVFAVQKMRHYLTGQTIHMISKVNQLSPHMMKPSTLNGCMTKWTMLVSQYDMQLLLKMAIKGQAITEFLVENLG